MKTKNRNIRRKSAKWIGLLLLFFIPGFVFGQGLRATYPVQATAVLHPPYSFYLSDYANPSRETIALVLLNRDLMTSEIEVRLHLSIRAGNGLRLETRDYNPLPVFRLPPGTPLRLSSSELAAYFQLQNLTVDGAFDGRLPEGMIEFCFTVYEVRTGALLSQTSCARVWLMLNRPPLLSLPQNKADFPFREPQQFFFQWTPRHGAISNVEYTFTLKEIFDRNTAVENAFAYSPVVFSKTVPTTSLAYTALDPPLLENTTYAWQVRAVVRDGFDELNLFENNGYSEIRSFSLQPVCHAPTDLSAIQEGAHEKISWTPSNPAAVQVVAYRGKQNGGDWHLIKGNMESVILRDLAPDTEFEYKAGTVCMDGSIQYSEVRSFVFEDPRKDLLAKCGIPPEITLDRSTRLATLSAGDVFRAFDFPVTVLSASGSDGNFTGTGWMRLPLFMDVKIAVKFNNIQINADRQLTDGFVESIYDALGGQMGDLDTIWSGGSNIKVDFEIPENPEYSYDEESSTLTIMDENGNPREIEIPKDEAGVKQLPIRIEDSAGNIYIVHQDEAETANGLAEVKVVLEKKGDLVKEFAVFYTNIEFNPVDTLFIIKGFNKDINLTFKKKANRQWNPINAFWRVNDNAEKTESESFDINPIEMSDFYVTAQQGINDTKDSIMIFVKYVDIDIEQEIIKTLLEIKDLEVRFDNLVNMLDKALEDEGWDKPLIKGIDDKYVQRGMHDYFEELTEPYEPCGFPIFDLFYQIYATDLLIAKYDGKFEQLIEKINSVMTCHNDGTCTVDNNFIQSVISQIAILHCASTADAIVRYKLVIEDKTIQNITTNE